MKKSALLLSLAFFLLNIQTAMAGGGAVQPLNFSHAQQISGKSFSPEVAIKDPDTGYSTPLSGREYVIQADGSLAGSSCDTTQRISDSSGKIKANCKADVFGKFGFNVIEVSSGANHAYFEVYFTESSSGFPEQGSTGTYTANIKQASFSTTLNATFTLEAVLKKDGQVTSNYDDVNFFRWEVLDGSISTLSAKEAKNRVLEFKNTHSGKTTLRVVVMMTDGSRVESGAIVISTVNPPSPTPVAQPKTESGEQKTGQGSTTSSPSPSVNSSPKATAKPSLTPSPVATPSPSATTSAEPQFQAEIESLKQQVAEQQEQLNLLQKIINNLKNFIESLF